MVRSGNVWRILMPAKDPAEEARAARNRQKTREMETAGRTSTRKDVLAHFDEYKSPGQLLEALDSVRQENKENEAQVEKQINERVEELKRIQATQPATNPQEAKERGMAESYTRLGAALLAGKAEEAAKYYFAEGDGGAAYVVARERRRLAGEKLIEAADKEIDSGASVLAQEFGLMNIADDLYGLAMKWEEQRENVDKKPGNNEWVPVMRNVGGVWRIDVTEETGGKATTEAQRAETEAKILTELAQRVREGKIQKMEALKKALRDAGVRGNLKGMAE